MLIENVLGFHRIDASARLVSWRKHQEGRHGIERLRFGATVIDIVSDGVEVEVNSNQDYTRLIDDEPFKIKPSHQTLRA